MSAGTSATVVALAAVLLAAGTARAADAPPGERDSGRLRELQVQINREQRAVRAVQAQHSALVESLRSLDQVLAGAEEATLAAERDAHSSESALATVEARIADLEEERRVLEAKLADRLRALYKFGRVGYVRILFSSKDYQDFARRSRFFRRVVQSDAELVEEFRGKIAALATERGRLDVARRSLEARRQAAAARRGDAEARREEKIALLAKLDQEKDAREEALKDLERSAGELQGVFYRLREVPRGAGADNIRRAAPRGAEGGTARAKVPPAGEASPAPSPGNEVAFSLLQGQLPLPAEGRIVKRFGLRTDPELRTQIRSNGITVRAPYGAPIRAVADGRVLYAGWFRGYGRILIVDHGEGYFTLVAHASELLRRVGDPVSAGEEIGRVGDSGSLEGPIVYFEIRKEGRPLDPKEWIHSETSRWAGRPDG